MYWSFCRNCKVKIEHENQAVQIFIKRRKRDPHNFTSKKYNFEFCDNCHKELYEKFPCLQPERSKREDSQCEMRCSEHCGNTVREVQ